MDVESLYKYRTQRWLDHPSTEMPPSEFLNALTNWTLNNNIFVFEDKGFKHVKGLKRF